MWFFKKLFKRKQRKTQQQLQHQEQPAPSAIPRIPSIPQLPRLELDLGHVDQEPAEAAIDKQVSIRKTESRSRPILPPEIWELIFSNLIKDDVCSVVQTCRLFQRLAEPLLYRRIRFTENSHAMVDYRVRIDRLAKTFAARPDLGYHVRLFSFVSSERTDLQQAYDEISGRDASHELPDDVEMARVLWQQPSKSTECLEMRVIKLLLHCLHVEDIQISTALLPLMELYDINQSAASSSGPLISSLLSRLRDVRVVRPPFWDQGLPLKQELEDNQRLKLICRPGLAKFKGMLPPAVMERVLENRRQETTVAQEDLLPPLERLADFTCVTVIAEKIDEFLACLPDLHSFRYLHTYTPPTRQEFHCKQLYENLQPVQRSLKRLAIKHDKSPAARYGREGPAFTTAFQCIGHFGSLRSFTGLTYLNIPWMLLTEHNSALSSNDSGTEKESIGNILPPNLEVLRLNIFLAEFDVYPGEDKGAIAKRRDALLTEFVRNWKTYTPRLQGIDYSNIEEDWGTNEFFLELGDLCREEGLFNANDYREWRMNGLKTW